MLHVSELRINNSVISHKHNGLITEIHTIMPNGVRLWANPFAPCYNFDEISGIPLTEELLLKMGFTLKADNAPEGFTNYATADVFYIHMGGSKCGPLAERGEFVWGDNYKTIETVHQLQNLYHALTGQELTLS